MRGYTPRFEPNPPAQPWAAEKQRQADTGENPDPGSRCLPPGVPRIMKAPYPFEFFVRPNRVDTLHEYQHMVRRIWTDGREHPKDVDPLDHTWMGHSIGKWEQTPAGEQFVVDTVQLNGKTWLDPGGDQHTDALHVTERYRLVNKDLMEIEFTIDDPKTYTRTWTTKLIYDRKPGWEIYEYICEENNKDYVPEKK